MTEEQAAALRELKESDEALGIAAKHQSDCNAAMVDATVAFQRAMMRYVNASEHGRRVGLQPSDIE